MATGHHPTRRLDPQINTTAIDAHQFDVFVDLSTHRACARGDGLDKAERIDVPVIRAECPDRDVAHRRLELGNGRCVELDQCHPRSALVRDDRGTVFVGVRPGPDIERALLNQTGLERVVPGSMQLEAAARQKAQVRRATVGSVSASRRRGKACDPGQLAWAAAQLEWCLGIKQMAYAFAQRGGRRHALSVARRHHAGGARRGANADLAALNDNRRHAAQAKRVRRAQTD